MIRFLLAATVAAIVASAATAQTAEPGVVYPSTRYPSSVIIEYPDRTVVTSAPVFQRPAIGLGVASSPLYYGPYFSVGGPGYAYHAYPPYNGWSSGYRGAYYGPPVPAYSRWR